jgi:hypothetical protein
LRSAPDEIIRREGDPPSEANGFINGPDWMTCDVKDGKLTGAGAPERLSQILSVLREWIEEHAGHDPS